MMQLSDTGTMALICREGIAQGWYRDSKGVLTIGVGHTAAAGEPSKPSPTFSVTVPGAFALFRKDVAQYEAAVRAAITQPMRQHEYDAFVSICYNIGTGAFRKSTFVRKFNAGDRIGCAKAIMLWTKDKELIPRRTGERDQFLHGLPLGQVFKSMLYGVGKNYELGRPGIVDLARALRIGDVAQEPAITERLPEPAEAPIKPINPESTTVENPGAADRPSPGAGKARLLAVLALVIAGLIFIPFIFGD